MFMRLIENVFLITIAFDWLLHTLWLRPWYFLTAGYFNFLFLFMKPKSITLPTRCFWKLSITRPNFNFLLMPVWGWWRVRLYKRDYQMSARTRPNLELAVSHVLSTFAEVWRKTGWELLRHRIKGKQSDPPS